MQVSCGVLSFSYIFTSISRNTTVDIFLLHTIFLSSGQLTTTNRSLHNIICIQLHSQENVLHVCMYLCIVLYKYLIYLYPI
jgi:hypothetical protein